MDRSNNPRRVLRIATCVATLGVMNACGGDESGTRGAEASVDGGAAAGGQSGAGGTGAGAGHAGMDGTGGTGTSGAGGGAIGGTGSGGIAALSDGGPDSGPRAPTDGGALATPDGAEHDSGPPIVDAASFDAGLDAMIHDGAAIDGGEPSPVCDLPDAAPEGGLPTFDYIAANFIPGDFASHAAVMPDVSLLDCGDTRFDSTSLTFENWCHGCAPIPTIIQQPGGPEAVVIPMRGIQVMADSRLLLVGSRPVIMAIFGDALLLGVISASAQGDGAQGAGANWQCGSSAGTDSPGAYGAGGGGFRTAGAKGGGLYGGSGGLPRGDATLIPLIGGCPGGAGGNGAPGGQGGGAVQLSVAGSILGYGGVAANGGPGIGSPTTPYGAGGGSGGAVLLEAMSLPSIAPAAAGGGEGGRTVFRLGGTGGSFTTLPQPGDVDVLGGASGGGGAGGRIRAINHSMVPPTDSGVGGG